jgi:hypothetical protein
VKGLEGGLGADQWDGQAEMKPGPLHKGRFMAGPDSKETQVLPSGDITSLHIIPERFLY